MLHYIRCSFTILLLLCSFTFANAQKVIKVGAFNYYPAIFLENDEVQGFLVETLDDFGKRHGYEIEYVYGSWDDGLKRLKNGDVDLLTSVAYTKERAEYMDYTTQPIMTVWGEAYVAEGSHIHSIKDFENRTIAVMASDFNTDHIKRVTAKMAIPCEYVEVKDFMTVFELVSKGNADIGIANNTFGAPMSVKYNLISTDVVLNPFEIFFAVRKGENREILDLLSSEVHQWKHDEKSVFNEGRRKWSHHEVDSIKIFPSWLNDLLISITVVILLFVFFIIFLRMRVKRAVTKATEMESNFKAFISNIPAYAFIKDEHDKLIFSNQFEDDSCDSRSSDVIDDDTKKDIAGHYYEVRNDLSNSKDFFYKQKCNGETKWSHDYIFKIPDIKNYSLIGGLSFDVTERMKLETELVRTKDLAEESNRMKTLFIQNLSHEIRTPMNSILGFSNLLSSSDFSQSKQEEFTGLIQSSANQLLQIIDELLEISLLESSKKQIRRSVIEVNGFLKEMHSMFELRANEKGLDFELNPHQSENYQLPIDQTILNKILNNLVDNAIKYTNEGKVSFGYRLQDDKLIFFVKDTGIGIDTEMKEKIFERFVQEQFEISSIVGGLGLGLSIALENAKLINGTIELDSEKGKGSEFRLVLPVEPAKKISETENGKLKILIAEDDENNYLYFNELLKLELKSAFQLYYAKDGLEAVDLYKKHSPDIIFMDIKMPILNGLDATERIREIDETIPVIAQTAYTTKDEEIKIYEAGCTDIITKPITKDSLKSIFDSFVVIQNDL